MHGKEKFFQNKINDRDSRKKNRNNKKIISELNSTKAHLNKIIAYKMHGTIIRSGARWHEQGERNGKYFYGLKKRNYSRKDVNKLKLSNGSYRTNLSDIFEKQKIFYENLYKLQVFSTQSARENDDCFLLTQLTSPP